VRLKPRYPQLLAVLLTTYVRLLILAADITPIDIISHLPVLCEEAQVPYVFVPSKEALGQASSTKRPTSCVMVCPDQKKAKKKEGEDEGDAAELKELFTECRTEVEKLDSKIVF
jgi:H/ACA ribonucleoprotein complex subunit 2